MDFWPSMIHELHGGRTLKAGILVVSFIKAPIHCPAIRPLWLSISCEALGWYRTRQATCGSFDSLKKTGRRAPSELWLHDATYPARLAKIHRNRREGCLSSRLRHASTQRRRGQTVPGI